MLYPLRFEPIFQYRLWGGRRLEQIMSASLPGDQPIGEAWILSDRDDFPSKVKDGTLKGKTIKELIEQEPGALLGRFKDRYDRFPLLLKFLDASDMLSVQVHPTDAQKQYLPKGERGKTEAWVVLQAGNESLIYAGLKPGTTPDDLRNLNRESVDKRLSSFRPLPGEGVLIPAGTVHALGGGVVVFEIQQNSDVTFRLYDWDRTDPHTGKPRELHVDEAIACVNFSQGEIGPGNPVVESTGPIWREALFACEFFDLDRIVATQSFEIGHPDVPTVAVCLEGEGVLGDLAMNPGDVYLIPACTGEVEVAPSKRVTVLEVAIPANS